MANTTVRIRGNMQRIHPAVDYVMKNAPCEVLVLSQGYVDANHNGVEAANSEMKATTVGSEVKSNSVPHMPIML